MRRLFGLDTQRVASRPTPFLPRRLSGDALQLSEVTVPSPSTASPISTGQTWAPVNTVANQDDVHELVDRIRFLSFMGSEDDRPLILEICDRVSEDGTAREAIRALTNELKHGSAAAQLSAARLWAVLLRNSSAAFVAQSTAPDFLKTIGGLLVSPQTAQVVRHRVLRVLGDAVFSNPSCGAFRALWVQVKPSDQPEHGSPYSDHDSILQPTLRSDSHHPFSPQSILDRLNPPVPHAYGYTHGYGQGIDSRFPYEWEVPPPSYETATGTLISSPSSSQKSRRTSSQSDCSLDTFLDIDSDGDGEPSETWSLVVVPPHSPVLQQRAPHYEQSMAVSTPPPRGPRLQISTPDTSRRVRLGNTSASPSPLSSPESPTPHTARPSTSTIRRLPTIGPSSNGNRAVATPPLPSIDGQSSAQLKQLKSLAPTPPPQPRCPSPVRRLPFIQADNKTNVLVPAVAGSSTSHRKFMPASSAQKGKGLYPRTVCYLQNVASNGHHLGLLASLDTFARVMDDLSTLSSLIYALKYRDTLLQISTSLEIADDPKLKAALDEDQIGIADILLDILYSPADAAAVLELDGDGAQAMLDIVQDTLDKALLHSREATSKARRLIGKLAKACDKLPSSLIISGVTQRDEHASFSGGFGDVYRAMYQGRPVALKRMRMFQTTDQRDIRRKFCREALTWQRLCHAYIVPLIGIDTESFPSSLCMVSPWMKNGTVIKYLSGIQDHHRRQRTVDHLIQEIAQGLAFLHDQKVVHGDLRGSNILVDNNGHACLTDFGLTVLSDSTTTGTNNGAGSVRWMAPEALHPAACGLQDFVRRPPSDIYAFGCVCLELYTGYPPFHDEILLDAPVMLQVMAGNRPNRPASKTISDQIWNIMQQCWSHDFAQRPSIIDIILKLGVSPIVSGGGRIADSMDPAVPPFQEDMCMTSSDDNKQYEGWVARVISPFSGFIDSSVNPRHHYLDLQEIAEGPGGTTLYVARLAGERQEELSLPIHVRECDQADLQAQRPTFVAIKSVPIMPTGSAKLVKVLRELRTMRGIQCENILGMDALYVDPIEDQLWIRMELMTRTLSSIIALNAAGLVLSDRVIAGCTKDVLVALESLWGNGVAPQDIRSEDVLMNSQGVLKLTNLSNTIQLHETSWRVHNSGPSFSSLCALVCEMAVGHRPPLNAGRHIEDWPSHPSAASRTFAFHEFIWMCINPTIQNCGYRRLIESSFIVDACERPTLAQLLVQCTAFEGRVREQKQRVTTQSNTAFYST